MKQIRWIEWAHPDLRDAGPFGIGMAILLGVYWEGYIYDHDGD